MIVCIVGSEMREDIGSGIPRYTYELTSNLVKVAKEPLYVKFVRYGNRPRDFVVRNLKKISFAVRVYPLKADIYHSTDQMLALPLILSRKRPIIATVHDTFPLHLGRDPLTRPRWDVDRYILRKCDSIVAIAECWKQDLVRYYGVQGDKIVVIPVGVNLEKFKPMQLRESDKELIGISRDRRVVLYVGGLAKERGLEILLRAFRVVTSKVSNVCLVISGKGFARYFKELAFKLGIGKHVRFAGFLPEEKLPFYYNMATVFVYPSFIGLGLMTLEACACGTPTISTNVFDIPEYLGDAAILVEPGNVDQLANAIIDVLTDESLRKELQRKGRQRALMFSWRRTAQMTWELYEELYHAGMKPS
jgi:glycosyltransferase involved in cell wall biosynthesis